MTSDVKATLNPKQTKSNYEAIIGGTAWIGHYIDGTDNRSAVIPHFLPPGVAHTTGLSNNPFTRRPLQDGEKTLMPKSSAMKSYVKLMRHPQHWYFPQFRSNMRKISAKRYRRAKLVLPKNLNNVKM